jgi:hypothetical protein
MPRVSKQPEINYNSMYVYGQAHTTNSLAQINKNLTKINNARSCIKRDSK